MAFYTQAQCDYCRAETNWKCRNEHPEWYDGNGGITEEFYDKILEYVNENTVPRQCLIAGDDEVVNDVIVNDAFCSIHLRTIADEMEDDGGNSKQSKSWQTSQIESRNLLVGPNEDSLGVGLATPK